MDTKEGWSSAEEAKQHARDSVRAAFEHGPELESPPERRCKSCGHEAATWRSNCPVCNKRYDRRLPWLKTWMRWTLAGFAFVLLAVTVAISWPKVDHSKKVRAAAEARAHAKSVAQERARLIREQRPIHGGAEGVTIAPADAPESERLASRRALAAAFRDGVLTEARHRIDTKELKPPVLYVHCDPLLRRADGKGLPDEEILTRTLGRYDCVAVKRNVMRDGKLVGYFGTPFVGTLDFATGKWVICKDNKVPGERGPVLAKVKLARECVGAAPDAPEVGNGYRLDPEDAPAATPETKPEDT